MAVALPWLALAVSAGSAIQQHQESNQSHEDSLKVTADATRRQDALDKKLVDSKAQNAQIEARDALRIQQKQQASAAGGLKSSSILTSPLGTTPGSAGSYNGGQKTLLGS